MCATILLHIRFVVLRALVWYRIIIHCPISMKSCFKYHLSFEHIFSNVWNVILTFINSAEHYFICHTLILLSFSDTSLYVTAWQRTMAKLKHYNFELNLQTICEALYKSKLIASSRPDCLRTNRNSNSTSLRF